MSSRSAARGAPTRGSGSTLRAAPAADASRCSRRRQRWPGGHSGVEIALGRANAIKVLGRVLRAAHATVPFRLVSLDGGKSRNAIPRDAVASSASNPARPGSAFRRHVETAIATMRDAYAKTDAGATQSPSRTHASAWTPGRTMRQPAARRRRARSDGPTRHEPGLRGARRDVARRSARRRPRAGASRCIASRARPTTLRCRSVIATLDAAARLAGGALEVKHNYNGWRPDLDSAVLAVCAPRVRASASVSPRRHGGARGARDGRHRHQGRPSLDMLAIGPQIEFPHSPDERVNIPTVERFWALLVAVVDELSASAK